MPWCTADRRCAAGLANEMKQEDKVANYTTRSTSSSSRLSFATRDNMVYCITVHLYAKDDPECIRKIKNKLIEASRVYSKGE